MLNWWAADIRAEESRRVGWERAGWERREAERAEQSSTVTGQTAHSTQPAKGAHRQDSTGRTRQE